MRRGCLFSLLAGVFAVALGIAWLAHPVCVPISTASMKGDKPYPLELRQDRDIFGFRTFQMRDGHWCQCKSWISRQLFF
jgi:hypothetical protein